MERATAQDREERQGEIGEEERERQTHGDRRDDSSVVRAEDGYRGRSDLMSSTEEESYDGMRPS